MRTRRHAPSLVGVVVAVLLVTSCGDGDPDSAATDEPAPTSSSAAPSSSPPSPSVAPTPTPTGPPTLSVAGIVAQGLEVPWGLAFLPDGSALVAQRGGEVVALAGGQARSLGSVPGVVSRGEGGLLGLAVGDDFAITRLVYAYLTASGDNRVVRMTYDGQSLGPPQSVVTGIPSGSIHNGGRIAFGPDGNLWVGTGDAGDGSNSQDRGSLGGKILRLTPDGTVPTDNPFSGSFVWSLGHRNVQGLGFDSQGRLWASEFGQQTYDELNLVAKGGNFGWPVVEGPSDDSRFVAPATTWATSEASPSGIAVVDDVVYVTALRGQRLWQVPIAGDGVATPVALLSGELGRLRTVEPAPDGSLWLATSNRDGRGSPRDGDDRIVQLSLS